MQDFYIGYKNRIVYINFDTVRMLQETGLETDQPGELVI